MSGWGIYENKNVRYEGEFLEDKFSGFGIFTD